MRILQLAGVPVNGLRLLVGIVTLALLSVGPAGAKSDGALSASVDKPAAKVGDLLWLSLKYTLPQGAHLPANPRIKGIEQLTVVKQAERDGEIRIQFLVGRLETFTIGPIGLTYIDKNGAEHPIEAHPVTVKVASNLGEKAQAAELRPIQDIIPTASRLGQYLIWAAAAVLFLGMLLGGWWWHQTRRTSNVTEKTIEPPHLRAERELNRLVADGQFEKGAVKVFYFRFSEILRQYMEAIRPFPAAEMTTEEIVRCCANNAQDQEIVRLLRQADLVKFADAVPTAQRKDQDLQTARTYIQHTRPGPAPESQTGVEAEP